jgi:methionyl aminopeptidase
MDVALPEETKQIPEETKKPRKKRGSRKKAQPKECPRAQDNSAIRLLGNWADGPYKQTCPPTVPLSKQAETWAEGEIINYQNENSWRTTSEEKRELERMLTIDYEAARKAAECHRQVRKWAQTVLRPGLELFEFVESLEDKTRTLLEGDGLDAGVGFPTGVSINHCAAHFTPNPSDRVVIGYDDVVKVDFGTHINGRIMDCAFTVAFNDKFDNLVRAPKEATNEGLKVAGIDVRLTDVGAAIQEVMESFEVELNGKVFPIKSIRNLNGHSIDPYHIHAGKSVPIVANGDNTKMEEGEFYAIETFGSTGRGVVHDEGECSHYMIDYDMFQKPIPIRDSKAKNLLKHIENRYATLPWCRRHLERDGQTRHLIPLRHLTQAGIITAYPPLCDVVGSYVAQFEHTMVLRPTCKEVLTRGEDY